MKKGLLLVGVMLFSLFISSSIVEANISEKTYHWGFKKGHDGIPAEAGLELETLIKKYDSFYKGDPKKKVIYLTFDNGYENGETVKILDVLKKEKVPATFFLTGHYIKSAPDLVKRMVKEGHIIGNHSYGHPDLTTISDAEIKKEWKSLKDEMEKIVDQKEMIYNRPPRGIFNERVLALAKEEGYKNVFWSVAYVDWNTDQQKGWQYAYNEMIKQAHPGAIYLLHSVSTDNAQALEKAITDLKKQGYSFKSLDNFK
jgi:peptidoglycan-N-acetylmuramic acid deacetylase